jgi:hypothetical protein
MASELMSAEKEERVDKKRMRMWAGPATALYINFIRNRHLSLVACSVADPYPGSGIGFFPDPKPIFLRAF